MNNNENGLPAKAVSGYLLGDNAEPVMLKTESSWDGDTYSWSLKRGEEVLLRSYDGKETAKLSETLEAGRKACMEADAGMYGKIRKLAEEQFFAEETDGKKRIGFEYKGQFITDPWMDESGRFELTDEEALRKYGADNVAVFIILASDRLSSGWLSV